MALASKHFDWWRYSCQFSGCGYWVITQISNWVITQICNHSYCMITQSSLIFQPSHDWVCRTNKVGDVHQKGVNLCCCYQKRSLSFQILASRDTFTPSLQNLSLLLHGFNLTLNYSIIACQFLCVKILTQLLILLVLIINKKTDVPQEQDRHLCKGVAGY